MKRYLTLAVLLAGAGWFYAAGSTGGALALVFCGALCETGFWFALFRRRHQEAVRRA